MLSFSAVCDEWTRKTEERMLAVFRRSIELLADELIRKKDEGGKLPWITGNLARSLVAQIGSMPSQGGSDKLYAGSDVGVIVAQALLGDDVFLGFQANYAKRMNYGFVGQDSLGRTYNQTGAGFVEYAKDAWPMIVKQAAEEIKQGVDGGT